MKSEVILEKIYDPDTIDELNANIQHALEDAEIPTTKNGIFKGVYEVLITWYPNEENDLDDNIELDGFDNYNEE